MSKLLVPVDQLDKDGIWLKTWPSIKDAQAALGITHISSVCRGDRPTDGGFKWAYHDRLHGKRRKKKSKKNKGRRRQEL